MIAFAAILCAALVFGEKDGYREVAKASDFRNRKQAEDGARFVAELRSRPREDLTAVEIQAEDMAEFSLWRDDPAHREQNIALLRKAHAQGPETIWGWSALAYLEDFGATNSVTVPKKDKYLHLGDIATDVLDFEPKRLETPKGTRRSASIPKPKAGDVLRTQLIELCGEDAVGAVLSAKGGTKAFAKLWEDDQAVADFLLSGPVFEPRLALESLMTMYLNDSDGWCSTEEGRKITIATAINARPLGKKDDPEKVMLSRLQCWAAYRRLSQRRLFDATTAKRDTREWRFIVRDPTSAQDILYLNSRPVRGQVAYRHFNCFGDYIFGPDYFRPWRLADWPYWYKVHRVGGICNRQSTYCAVSSNAHGLMAERAGQPNHCAWLLRDEKGVWNIKNDINKFTAGVFTFWGHGYQYIQATERAFESREKWDRSERLRFRYLHERRSGAKPQTCEKLLHESIAACPYNLSAWRDYTDFLKAEKCGGGAAETWKKYLSVLVRAMPEGRTATWDLAFEALGEMRKAGAGEAEILAEAVALVKALPEPAKQIPEEMNYDGEVLKRMGKVFKDVPQGRFRVLVTALEANWGTRHYFSQILSHGLNAYAKDAEASGRFMDAFGRLAKHHDKKGEALDAKGLNWRQLIGTASTGRQREAFQTFAALRNRLQPPPKGTAYPATDFDGRLVSDKGLLYTSGRVRGDCPEDYPRVIDASPLRPKRTYQVAMKPAESPWAVVQLQGLCKVSGIRVTGEKLTQTVVSISEDGETWETVKTDDAVEKGEMAVALAARPKAKFVRVGRVENATKDPLRIAKILVYGETLY